MTVAAHLPAGYAPFCDVFSDILADQGWVIADDETHIGRAKMVEGG